MKTSIFYCLGSLALMIFVQCSAKDTKCTMPPEPGMCMAAIPKYYYNQQTGQCEPFTWGGCGDYPFDQMESCEEACE